jgi:hypothetical protein
MLAMASTAVLLASAGITGSLALLRGPSSTLGDMRSRVDGELLYKLDTLLDSQPGNPHDAEIWELIKDYGILRFLAQARIQVGIATLLLQERPDFEADQLERFSTALVNLRIALLGCCEESIASIFRPQTARMQALTAAHTFSWLCMDVEQLAP